MMMELLKHTAKIRDYCDYLDEHALNVQKAWKIVQEKCKHMNVVYDDWLWGSINHMIQWHDLSKVSPQEFIQYQRQFFPADDEQHTSFDAAWEHHKAKNPHHWQNWTHIETNVPNALSCHCVCMVCDWMAMGMKFGDTAQEYYEKNRDNINLPDWAHQFVMEMFGAIYGEPPEKESDNA